MLYIYKSSWNCLIWLSFQNQFPMFDKLPSDFILSCQFVLYLNKAHDCAMIPKVTFGEGKTVKENRITGAAEL